VNDPGWRKRIASKQLVQTIPPKWTRLTASGKPFLPDPLNLMGVPSQSTAIACNAVIGVVAPHHLTEMEALFGKMPMQLSGDTPQPRAAHLFG
jgi:hypothetical protein